VAGCTSRNSRYKWWGRSIGLEGCVGAAKRLRTSQTVITDTVLGFGVFLADRITCAVAYNFVPLVYRTLYGSTMTPRARTRCQLMSGVVSLVPHILFRTAYVRMLVCVGEGSGYSTPLQVRGPLRSLCRTLPCSSRTQCAGRRHLGTYADRTRLGRIGWCAGPVDRASHRAIAFADRALGGAVVGSRIAVRPCVVWRGGKCSLAGGPALHLLY
jgi:hypothetical protein